MHTDSIDLLVTAAIACLTDDHELTHNPTALVTAADTFGQILTDQIPTHGSPALAAYRWQPVAELLTPTLVDDLVLQLERTRLAYIDAAHAGNDWEHSPARRYIDRLGTTIRERIDRDTIDPNQMILTTSELEETTPEWRRPTIYAQITLIDQEHNHGRP